MVAIPGGYVGINDISPDSANIWFKAMLWRFDTNGDTLWTKTYTDSINMIPYYIKRTRKNRYIIGATEWRYYNNNPLFISVLIEIDTSGNILWEKAYPCPTPGYNLRLGGVDTCNDGGFILSNTAIDTNRTVECSRYIYIIKTDSSGNVQWQKQVYSSSPCNTITYGIITLRHDSYVVCGYRDSTSYGLFGEVNSKLYMVKINNSGLPVWQKQYGIGGAQEGAVTLTTPYELADGDIVACGDGNFKGHALGCILKTDSNGNQRWLHFIASDSQSYADDFFYDIKPTPDKGFVSCGYVYANTQYTWVVKTDSNGCADSAGCNYLGIEPLVKNKAGFKIYPNPSNGKFTIQWQLNGTQNGVNKIEIYNMLGEKIYSAQLSQTAQQGSKTVNLSSQPNGIYLVRIMSENGNTLAADKIMKTN